MYGGQGQHGAFVGQQQGYGGAGGGSFVPGNAGPATGYRGYEFVPAQQQQQQQQVYMQQQYGGYAQMNNAGYFYPSGNAAPMGPGMYPGANGYTGMGMTTAGNGIMNGPPGALGMGGMPNGQGGPSRFPTFTPHGGGIASPNGVNVNGVGAHIPTSPYPAYQHASSVGATSPSMANATTQAPMNGGGASPQNPAAMPNGMNMPTYGMEQNPYAHLHQHANHPHHNPYAAMANGMSPYGNGNPYQPYAPIHQQLAGPGGPISPALMHAQVHPPSITPKMSHRSTYGYPVLPTAPNAPPTRKPVSISSPTRPSMSEGTSGGHLNGHASEVGASAVDEESSDEEAVASDGEPVFASINQAVAAQKAKKSKRKASVEEQVQKAPVETTDKVKEEVKPSEPKPVEPETQVQQPMTDSFMDASDSVSNDLAIRPPPWISTGRPYPIEAAPGVVFHRKTPFPARLYPDIKTWEQVEQREKSVKAEGKVREQSNAVVLRQRRKIDDDAERTFGEVTKDVLAQVEKEKKEREAVKEQEQQRAEQTSAEVTFRTEKPQESEPKAQTVEARSETPAPAKSVTEESKATVDDPSAEAKASETSIAPPPSETSAIAASLETPAPAPAPAPAKAAPKSWAALLRGAAPKQTPAGPAVSSPTGTVPLSNVTSPKLAQSAIVEEVAGSSENQPPQKAIVVPEGGPAPAPVAPSKPTNAWGSRPMIVPDQLDLGKLLAEGLDERTRASLKKVTSVPRGLINTGNMCFANSVSLSH